MNQHTGSVICDITMSADDDGLGTLVTGVRAAVEHRAGWDTTAQLVAEALRRSLPSPDVLTATQRLGSPDGYRSHTLHVEADGSFSIIALVWRPGQVTRIHDHVTWCAFGVVQGSVQEELFDDGLKPIATQHLTTGDVGGFAPPGDIHRVRNTSDTTAISFHVYGIDIDRIGSSAHRYYSD
jgi:predicted metal-dependent enzyme (double-stranded beta helix superfamily)